jgi:outer membrane protein TolC
MRPVLLVCVATVLYAGAASAQTPPPRVLTLDQAISEATTQSPTIKIAAFEVDKSRNQIAANRTRRLPNFQVSGLTGTLVAPFDLTFVQGAFGTFPDIGPIPAVDTKLRTNPAFIGLLSAQVAQPLTQLRRVSIGDKALTVGRQLAEEKLRAERQAVANNVKRLYYGIIQAQSGITANDQALAMYRELERLMNEYLERQVVLKGDALQVSTAVARQEQTAVSLRNTIATLKQQMNVLMGRDVSEDFSIVGDIPDTFSDMTSEAAQTRALQQRPEIRDAQLKLQQAEYDLRLTKEDRVPQISLTFNYLGFFNFEVLPHTVAIVGVNGTWEPWDWGRRQSEAAAKAHTVEQANLGVQAAQSLVKVDASTQLRKMQEAYAMLHVADLARQTTAERLRVATEQFRQQATLQRQVLEAQAADAEANQQYQQALAGFWTARADFQKAVGEQ